MRNRKQVLISGGMIVLALSVVGAYAATRPDEQAGAAGGHNHAAMGGGTGDAKPVTLDAESARRIGVSYVTVEAGPMTRVVRTVGAGFTGIFRALDAVVAAPFLLFPVGTRALRAGLASAVVAAIALRNPKAPRAE